MKVAIRNIFEPPIRQVIPWLAIVLLITFVGKQPGVVCDTPMTWLIALRVGNIRAWRSRSETATSRYLEASLAGGVLGLLQGIFFAVVSSRVEPIGTDDAAKAVILTISMIVVGMVVGALLAFITAYLSEQKMNRMGQ